MGPSALHSYLLTNKRAVKLAIKVSISIWGALFFSLIFNFEHPIWAMVTGMVSFFAPDHAQVIKKCLYQCISTLLGGIVGVILMNFVAQSPLMTAVLTAFFVFISASISFHSRDANTTFCCAFFTVTICIIVTVPPVSGVSSALIVDVFIDRVGTILLGIAWATLVSALIWPVYATDALRATSRSLLDKVVELGAILDSPDANARADKVTQIYSTVIQGEDLSAHCDFEGHWGRLDAGATRSLNKLAIDIVTQAYIFDIPSLTSFDTLAPCIFRLRLHLSRFGEVTEPALKKEVEELSSIANDVNDALGRLPLGRERTLASKLLTLITLYQQFFNQYLALISCKGSISEEIIIGRHPQWENCFRTGFRSASYYLVAFGFWYATGWIHGFLMTVVPVVFSIMLGKLPHPEMILRSILIGIIVSIPVGLLANTLLLQAPSAFEILVLTGGFFLFFGLMGLSSLTSFGYSLGFNIAYMVFILPTNQFGADMAFSIERALSLAIGVVFLAFLYLWIPRAPLLKDSDRIRELFQSHLVRASKTSSLSSANQAREISREIGLALDKLVHVATQETPELRNRLIAEAERAIFLMVQFRELFAFARDHRDATFQHRLDTWCQAVTDSYLEASEQPRTSLKEEADSGDPSYEEHFGAYLETMEMLANHALARRV